jgi:hypothetical protein
VEKFGFTHVSLLSMAFYSILSGVYGDISVLVLCQTTDNLRRKVTTIHWYATSTVCGCY